MRKMWLVAKHEYLSLVFCKSFLLSTLGLPVVLGVVGVIAAIAVAVSLDFRPAGYVDEAGILVLPPDATFTMRSFDDRQEAQAALEVGEIQGFYVLLPDYRHSREVEFYYWQDFPTIYSSFAFNEYVRQNLTIDLQPDIRRRVREGVDITVHSLDNQRGTDAEGVLSMGISFVCGLFFMVTIISSADYLLGVVADEKKDRTIEIMITSVSPGQFIGGKTVGLLAVAWTQLLVWFLSMAAIPLFFVLLVSSVLAFEIPWALLGIIVLYFVPTCVLIAGLMIMIGSIVPDTRQGQQIASFFSLAFMMPAVFAPLVFVNPNNSMLLVFTFIPFTSFITIVLRWGVTVVPFWQLLLSWLLLVGTAGASIWAATRLFRVGMLRYGQRLALRTILNALRIRRKVQKDA